MILSVGNPQTPQHQAPQLWNLSYACFILFPLHSYLKIDITNKLV